MATVGYGNGTDYEGTAGAKFQTGLFSLLTLGEGNRAMYAGVGGMAGSYRLSFVGSASVGGSAGSAYPGISVFMTNCESYQFWKFPTTFTTYTFYGIDAGLFRMFSGQVFPTSSLQVTAGQVWPTG